MSFLAREDDAGRRAKHGPDLLEIPHLLPAQRLARAVRQCEAAATERVVLVRVKHGAREHRRGDAAVPQISVRGGNVEERRGISVCDQLRAWSCESMPFCEILVARLVGSREVAERDPWRVAYDGVIRMD